MSVHFSDLANKAALDGKVSPEEILALRQLGWADGRMSQAEAEAIFRLNDEVDSNNSQWVDFFVEAIGEYVVNQREPRGYVDADNAIWLIQMIDADGKLCTMAELELLLRVFERAKNVPDRLKTYAVEKVEQAVLTGVGPTRDGGALQAGNVNATEAKLLRRAIFAPASERPAAVGQREAEMLFRLKDATLDAKDNAPEWKRLFVQGVANYLQGYSNPVGQLSRERAAELEAFMNDSLSNIGRFLGRMASGASFVVNGAFNKPAEEELSADEKAYAEHDITDSETLWLNAQMAVNGQIDEYEEALLSFLADNYD